ncbi:hypothetical protein Tco_0336138 [Tanacetum coccineum]
MVLNILDLHSHTPLIIIPLSSKSSTLSSRKDDLEPDNESVDTPLVSPFLDSDDDSDDGKVLNEVEEYEILESKGRNLVAIVRDVYVFVGSFTYITDFVVLEDIGEFILRDMSEVVMGKAFRKVTKLEYDSAKGLMSFTRIFDNYTFQMPRTIPSKNDKELSRMSRMEGDLFTYEVEIAEVTNIPCDLKREDDSEQQMSHESDNDMEYDPYDARGDDDVELTDEESSNSDDEDEVAKIFRIETNVFDFKTPLCRAFKEFNYLFQIDPDVLTKDIDGFKTYEEYKDDWIYEWNKDVPLVHERPWTENGVWKEPTLVKHHYFTVLEDMDAYHNEGMGDVIFCEPFLREVRINARRFKGMITAYNGNEEVTYQMVRYGYIKNHKKTVKNGQARTRERKSAQKPEAKPRKNQALSQKVVNMVNQSQLIKDKTQKYSTLVLQLSEKSKNSP